MGVTTPGSRTVATEWEEEEENERRSTAAEAPSLKEDYSNPEA
jgi:hypothetical protein